MIFLIVELSFLLLGWTNARLNPELSKTPPMGWSSWNRYHTDINEKLIKDSADALVRLGLDKLGYQYINIDDGWAHRERNEEGHVIVVEDKFPNGIKHVADYVHRLNLKFGIYSDSGNWTCAGSAGSYGYEDIDVSDYA